MARNATLAEAIRIAHRMRAGQETAEEIDALSGWLAEVLQPTPTPAASPPVPKEEDA